MGRFSPLQIIHAFGSPTLMRPTPQIPHASDSSLSQPLPFIISNHPSFQTIPIISSMRLASQKAFDKEM